MIHDTWFTHETHDTWFTLEAFEMLLNSVQTLSWTAKYISNKRDLKD